MNTRKGFTVIELVVMIALLIVVGILAWSQINNIEIARRDDKRRTAINAMYYNLEEVYYPTNKSYPRTIDEKILTAMDKELFTDPNDAKLGTGKSTYRYEPIDCTDNACKGYSLRADLEAESDYIKTNRNK